MHASRCKVFGRSGIVQMLSKILQSVFQLDCNVLGCAPMATLLRIVRHLNFKEN